MRRTRHAAMVLLLALAAGCGASSEPAASPATPSAPAAVQPSPIPPVRVEGLLQGRIRIDGGPDRIVVSKDAVWVKGDDGRLHRVDPRTGRVVATIPAATRLCQGLGASGDEVWVCTDDGIARVDPTTNRLTVRAAVGRLADQTVMPIGQGHVWVLPGDGRTLIGVSTQTGAVDIRAPLPAACFGAALAGDELWLTCRSADLVLRVRSDGTIAQRVEGLAAPTDVTAADAVYVAYVDGIARLDPASGRVTAAVQVSADQGLVLAVPGALWVRSATTFLRRLDPASLSLVQEVASAETAGGSVAIGFGSVWASVFDNTNGSLYRLRA